MNIKFVEIPIKNLYKNTELKGIVKIWMGDLDSDNKDEIIILSIKETEKKLLGDIIAYDYDGYSEKTFIELKDTNYTTFDIIPPGILVGILRGSRSPQVSILSYALTPEEMQNLGIESSGIVQTEFIGLEYKRTNFREKVYSVRTGKLDSDEYLILFTNCGVHCYSRKKIISMILKHRALFGFKYCNKYYGMTPRLLEKALERNPKLTIIRSRPIIGDFDGDGKNEIGYYVLGKEIKILDTNLKPIANIEMKLRLLGLANYDYNKDGKDEIFLYLGGKNPQIFIVSIKRGGYKIHHEIPLPFESPERINAPLVIDDINHDGKPEIVIVGSKNSRDLYILDIDGKILHKQTFPRTIMSIGLGDIDGDGYKEIIVGSDTLYIGRWIEDDTIKTLKNLLANRDILLSLLAIYKPPLRDTVKKNIMYDKKLFDRFLENLERNPSTGIKELLKEIAPNVEVDQELVNLIFSYFGRLYILAHSAPYLPPLIKEVPIEFLPLDLIHPKLVPEEILKEIKIKIDPLKYPQFFLSLKLSEDEMHRIYKLFYDAWRAEFTDRLLSLLNQDTVVNIAIIGTLAGGRLKDRIFEEIQKFIEKQGIPKDTLEKLYILGAIDLPDDELLSLIETDTNILLITIDRKPDFFIRKADKLSNDAIGVFIVRTKDTETLSRLVRILGPERTMLFLSYLPPQVIPKEYWEFYLEKMPQIVGENAPPEMRVRVGLKTGKINLIISGIRERVDLVHIFRDKFPKKIKVLLYAYNLLNLTEMELDDLWDLISKSKKSIAILAKKNPEYLLRKINSGDIPSDMFEYAISLLPHDLQKYVIKKPRHS